MAQYDIEARVLYRDKRYSQVEEEEWTLQFAKIESYDKLVKAFYVYGEYQDLEMHWVGDITIYKWTDDGPIEVRGTGTWG